ncbi:MAG TPA: hypothetical protein PKJ63_02040 [Cyclobacteriaceae bacterium]|nr:hypothetical protein [Cyclobacteriaceae bacterium]
MNNFIKALYADLLHRIDVVVVDIKGMAHHEDIKDRFINDTLNQFSAIRNELQNALDSGVLELDIFSGNNLYRFNRAHREFKAIHSYRYLAIKNYKDPEIFFYQVISQIYSEHRISALPPIVSTISNHDYYYWAVPYFEIIALPSGEEHSLLNLPDMYHEIGHLLHSMFGGKSCENSTVVVDKHFAKEIVRVIDDGTAAHFQEVLELAKYLWQESWLEEFTCDLVGTYMTGASYAWTNLKLLSTGHGSTKIFEYSQSHPADEARMRIIILMLEKLGLDDDKTKVEAAWRMFLKDTEVFKPKDYSLLYPQKLLQHIVDEFYTFYQNADLASHPELLSKGGNSISCLLNEAWGTAQLSPSKYFIYEMDSINRLRMNFGLEKI